jgi:origin recognition complex subunit 3
LQGVQFDVEQTSKTLERIFRKVVGGVKVPLMMGPGFIAAVLERQHDHVQSLQAFIGALKVWIECPLSFAC